MPAFRNGATVLGTSAATLAILSGIFAGSLRARAPATHDPVLTRLEARLTETLHQSSPQATVGYDEGRLVARFRTQTFLVHALGRRMDRSIPHYNPKPFPEIGPDYGGFALELFTDANPSQQALAAGNLEREPYWTRYFMYYQLRNPGGLPYLWVTLKYNEGTDPAVIARIEKIVEETALANAPR